MEKRIGNILIRYIRVKRALTKSALGFYTLNHYIGCTHACDYCYAGLYAKKFYGLDTWGDVVLVKENALHLLRKEVKKGMNIWLSSMSDPYQPIEAVEQLTRKIIGILGRKGANIDILTKNPLVLRDLDLLIRYRATVGFTIISTRPNPLERRAPHPRRRIYALRKLKEAGIRTYVFVGPILPETDVERIIELTKDYADLYYFDRLRHARELDLVPYYPDRSEIRRIAKEHGINARILF